MGDTASVRSNFPARGEYALQEKTSILMHSLDVAQFCMDSLADSVVKDLAVIAALGHDLGKLDMVHVGRYTELMHAYWGAKYVRNIVGGRLNEGQADAIFSAIMDHGITSGGAVQRALRDADFIPEKKRHWLR